MWFLLILVALPLVEIALFVQIGGLIGLWPTLLLVLAAGVAGLSIMRAQGIQSVRALSANLESGGDPTGPLAHGALVMVAGGLLFVPGFFTDFLGLMLLIPPVRRWLIGRGAAKMTARASGFSAGLRRGGGPARDGRPGPRRAPETIEAEYEVLDEGEAPRRGNSGWTRPDA